MREWQLYHWRETDITGRRIPGPKPSTMRRNLTGRVIAFMVGTATGRRWMTDGEVIALAVADPVYTSPEGTE